MFLFLHKACELGGKHLLRPEPCRMDQLATELAFERQHAEFIAGLCGNEGLITREADRVELTNLGLRHLNAAEAAPGETTGYFPAYVIVFGWDTISITSQEKADELRRRYLRKLCEISRADSTVSVRMYEVAFRLNIDGHTSDEIMRHLEEEGLIRTYDLGMYPVVYITDTGIQGVDQTLTDSDRPAEGPPAVSGVADLLGGAGSVAEGAGPGAGYGPGIDTDARDALRALCRALTDSFDQLKLASDDAAALTAQVEILKREAESPQPRRPILRPCLTLTRELVGSAAFSVAATGLREHIDNVAMLFGWVL